MNCRKHSPIPLIAPPPKGDVAARWDYLFVEQTADRLVVCSTCGMIARVSRFRSRRAYGWRPAADRSLAHTLRRLARWLTPEARAAIPLDPLKASPCGTPPCAARSPSDRSSPPPSPTSTNGPASP